MAELSDVVFETAGNKVWTHDCSAFYYVRLDPQHRLSSVHCHRLGADVREDTEIYAGTRWRPVHLPIAFAIRPLRGNLGAGSRYVGGAAHRLARLRSKPHAGRPARTGDALEVAHDPDFGGGPALIILTNAGGAEDFKIAWTPLAAAPIGEMSSRTVRASSS
jgi:oligopeptidase B